MPNPSDLEDLPHLDDQDVAILYDIILLAQESRDRPYKALFQARETILEQHDSEVEQNSKYLRFLLKAGGHLTRDGTSGLVKRFRNLLSHLGIQLVFGDGELEERSDTQEDGEAAVVEDPDGATHEVHVHARSRRRASFNDSNLDTTWISADRIPQMAEEPPKSSRYGASQVRGIEPHREIVSADPIRSDKSGRKRREGLINGQSSRRTRSSSAQGNIRMKHEAYAIASHTELARNYVLDPELAAPIASTQETFRTSRDQPGLSPLLFKPTESQLLSDAIAFHFNKVGRRCFHEWHHRAILQRQRRQDLERLATNHDRAVLTRQSLAQLKDSMSDNGFWDQQERRAARARDLFLMTKAFTHWAQTASDEIMRTSVAQRHILRTRYFNAWRDITVVNELKCRRLGLRKWFSTWRLRATRRVLDNDKADRIYRETQLEHTYWKWFWSFCDLKAPLWKDERLKRMCLDKLRFTSQARVTSGLVAEKHVANAVQRLAMTALVRTSQNHQSQEKGAIEFRHLLPARKAFNDIKTQSQLGPMLRVKQQTTQQKLLRACLSIWVLNYRSSKDATSVDRRRLLQNALSEWNDQLRVRTLGFRIDDRLVAQALYKWALEERLRLFQRVVDRRLKDRVMNVMSQNLSMKRFRLNEAMILFGQGEERRLMRFGMLRMNATTRIAEISDRTAAEFRSARDIRMILDLWKDKTAHARQLNRWASDARFYCLTTTTLRRWKDATIHAQKAKRRDAYASVRRKGKVALVTRCFGTWRTKSQKITSDNARAVSKHQAHLQKIVESTALSWSEQTRIHIEQFDRAAMVTARRLSSFVFSTLQNELRQVYTLHATAENEMVEASERLAGKMFKKLGDSLFLLRRGEETALAWKERKSGQHRRNMLRYWAYQAMAKRTLHVVEDPDSPTKRDINLFGSLRLPSARKQDLNDRVPIDFDIEPDLDFGATQRAEEWTQYGFLGNTLPVLQENPDSDTKTVATPLPGYMRTPSKRTARTRARFRHIPNENLTGTTATASHRQDLGNSRLNSTTPAPLAAGGLVDMEALTAQITPFNRKMRAGGYVQESTTPATAPPGTVSRFGQSRFGRGSEYGQETGRIVRFGNVTAQSDTPAPHQKSS